MAQLGDNPVMLLSHSCHDRNMLHRSSLPFPLETPQPDSFPVQKVKCSMAAFLAGSLTDGFTRGTPGRYRL